MIFAELIRNLVTNQTQAPRAGSGEELGRFVASEITFILLRFFAIRFRFSGQIIEILSLGVP